MKNYILTHQGLFIFQIETNHGPSFTNISTIAEKFTREEAERIAEAKGYGFVEG